MINANLKERAKLDYSTPDTLWLTNEDTLRIMVGVLGISLPLILYLSLMVESGRVELLDSISHYYFTRVGSVFVIILSIIGVFLIIYQGTNQIDFLISIAAGVAVFVLLLFPASNLTDISINPIIDRQLTKPCSEAISPCFGDSQPYSVTVLKTSKSRVYIHYIASAIFLGCLTYMALFCFPKQESIEKRNRKTFYRICGLLMLGSMVAISCGIWFSDFFDKYLHKAITFVL